MLPLPPALAAPPPGPALAGELPAGWLAVYPQVSVNGASTEALAAFGARGEVLHARLATLRELGIDVPAEAMQSVRWAEQEPAAPVGERWFELSSLTGLQSEYHADRQTLALTAPLAWLRLSTTMLDSAPGRAERAVAQPGYAFVLNYDASAGADGLGGRRLGMFTESRFTTPWGYLNHTWLWRHDASADWGGMRGARLDTYWRSVWPRRGIALTVGDTFTSQLWGSAGTRMGGVKLEKNFSLQPWRDTAPLTSYLGSSTLPSTVDLYLNGVRRYSQQVPAGPYNLTLPPGISGAGMAQVVTTDALGRTTVVDMPLYGGSGLLAKGLGEWSVEAGYIRKSYGLQGSGYGDRPLLSATARYGLTNRLTGQAHAEAVRGYRQLGLGASWVMGPLGQLNASYASSQYQGRRGAQQSLAFSTQRGGWSFGLGHSQSDERFTTMAATLGADPFRPLGQRNRVSSASLGWGSQAMGSWQMSYVRSQQGSAQAEQTAMLGWSRNLGRRASVYLGAAQGLSGPRQRSFFASLSVQLDHRLSARASTTQGTGGASYQADVRRTASDVGTLGWNLGGQWQRGVDGGRAWHAAWAGAQYNSVYGDGWANMRSGTGHTDWDASWRGGLVWMQGGLFATKTVNDSFAVVSTNGVAGIPVRAQNSVVGVTNQRGRVFVPNLMAFQDNIVSIDTLGLPANMRIERAQAEAVPAERSGVSVRFEVSQRRSVLLTLSDGRGGHAAVGGTVRDAQGQPVAVVGFDGQVFLEDVPAPAASYQLDLADQGRRCRFDVAYPPGKVDIILNLGEIACRN